MILLVPVLYIEENKKHENAFALAHFYLEKKLVSNCSQNNAGQQNIQLIQQIKMTQEQFQKYVENFKPPD